MVARHCIGEVGADASDCVFTNVALSSLDEAKTVKSVNANLHRENEQLREQSAMQATSNKKVLAEQNPLRSDEAMEHVLQAVPSLHTGIAEGAS